MRPAVVAAACALTDEAVTPWRSSGPAMTRCDLRDLPRRLEQVLDPFPGSDPARRRGRPAPPRGCRAAPAARRSRRQPTGLGKAVAAHVHLLAPARPHATTSSRSRSDATTTAAAPRGRRRDRASRRARASVRPCAGAARTSRAARRRRERARAGTTPPSRSSRDPGSRRRARRRDAVSRASSTGASA